MEYLIIDTNKKVNEKDLRKLLFEYEVQDLLDNKEDFLNGFLSLDLQLDCIQEVLFSDINEIIYRLETCWNVPIEKITVVQ